MAIKVHGATVIDNSKHITVSGAQVDGTLLLPEAGILQVSKDNGSIGQFGASDTELITIGNSSNNKNIILRSSGFADFKQVNVNQILKVGGDNVQINPDGSSTFAGTVAVNELTIGGSSVNTSAEVDAKIAAIPATDLSGYDTSSQVDSKISTAIGAIPSVDLSGYDTSTEVDAKIAAIPSVDLAGYDTSAQVNAKIANLENALINGAPEALNTLVELSTALGNDANFATTVTNSLAGKANLSGATFTGTVDAPAFTVNGSPLEVSGSQTIISDTAPSTTDNDVGTLWWNSDSSDGSLYVLYQDPSGPAGDSGGKYWIEASPAPDSIGFNGSHTGDSVFNGNIDVTGNVTATYFMGNLSGNLLNSQGQVVIDANNPDFGLPFSGGTMTGDIVMGSPAVSTIGVDGDATFAGTVNATYFIGDLSGKLLNSQGQVVIDADNPDFGFDGNLTGNLDVTGNASFGGNVISLGVTPEAWHSGVTRALRIGAGGAISSQINNRITEITTNAWHSGTSWKYIANDSATNYYQYLGEHVFNVAPSGTADNDITFTEILRINSSGINVSGAGTFAGGMNIAGFVRGGDSNILYIADDIELTSGKSLLLGGANTKLSNDGTAFTVDILSTEMFRVTDSGVKVFGNAIDLNANGSASFGATVDVTNGAGGVKNISMNNSPGGGVLYVRDNNGDVNVTLNGYDGSASFEGAVAVNNLLYARQDTGSSDAFSVYSGGLAGSNKTANISGNGSATFAGGVSSDRAASGDSCFIARHNGTANAIISSDGSATFGNVGGGNYAALSSTSLGFYQSNSANIYLNGSTGVATFAGGITARQFTGSDGLSNFRRDAVGSNPVVQFGSPSAINAYINIDGSATFAGVNQSGAFHVTDSQYSSDNDELFRIIKNGVRKAKILGNGSATFASEVVAGVRDSQGVFMTSGGALEGFNNGSRVYNLGSDGSASFAASKFTIQNDGDLVLGASGGSALTQIYGNGDNSGIHLSGGGGGSANIEVYGTFHSTLAKTILFNTNSQERMRIDSTGRTAVWRNTSTSGEAILVARSNYVSTNRTQWYVLAGDGQNENRNGVYTSISSDERLKKDITDASSQWTDIKNIRMRKFRYKGDPADSPLQLGVVAQELESVCPNLVTRKPATAEMAAESDGMIAEGEDLLSWKQSIVHLKALKALQEAMDRIETLEAKVAALEAG